MNIHIGCPSCGYEWDDSYIGNGIVDISEVHGAEVVESAESEKGRVRLVRIEDVYLVLTTFRTGAWKGTCCKVVDKEKAHPMFAQAVTDVSIGKAP